MTFRGFAVGLFLVATVSGSCAEALDAQNGKGLYITYCLRCHGRNMVTPGTVFYDLRQFPADDKARFENSVKRGKKTMPAWGDKFDPQQLDDLWAYVLTRGK